MKEELLKSLLVQEKGIIPGGSKLIEEIGNESGDCTDANFLPPPPAAAFSTKEDEDGPSIMDLMIEAQKAAQNEKEKMEQLEKKRSTNKFGGGFKKGFFGNNNTTSSVEAAAKKTVTQTSENITFISKPKSSQPVKKGPVLAEVQEAMANDANPLVKQLKDGATEWATPDLMESFKSNPVLSRGLTDRKCMAAMQMMQTNPTEAKRLFSNDKDVTEFYQEFGKVMAAHFDNLGRNSMITSQDSGVNRSIPKVQDMSISAGNIELGPLHAQALKNMPNSSGGSSYSSMASDAYGNGSGGDEKEEARVRDVLGDAELRDMLLDPKLQHIIQECNDPFKFRMHMANPDTAAKIKRLFDSGLVGVAK